jgi:hypothetical membrane protein
MTLSNASKAGTAIFVGVSQWAFFLVVSEILYSASGTGGYSVSANHISDLGANCPDAGGACYIPPSALLFDSSVALMGLLLIIGAYFFYRAYRWKPGSAMIALVGVGALGVGFFPETAGTIHSIFSDIAFLFAGLAAIVTARFQKKPLFYFSIILGFITLAAILLYRGEYYLGLGAGGMERMVVYPVVLWGLGFGGHLMAMDDVPRT